MSENSTTINIQENSRTEVNNLANFDYELKRIQIKPVLSHCSFINSRDFKVIFFFNEDSLENNENYFHDFTAVCTHELYIFNYFTFNIKFIKIS